MAKHDQRIQKFLQQNVDRSPTITDMMTRLNISISEISDSLNSLWGQGLITKKTNGQGIECWFPASFATSSTPTPPFSDSVPSPSGNGEQLIGDIRTSAESRPTEMRAMRGIPEMQAPIPQAQTSAPKAPPVQVQHIPGLERASSQTQSFQAMGQVSHSAKIEGPGVMDTRAFKMDSPQAFEPRQASTFMTAEPKTGISLLTFAIGLIAAVAISTWFSSRLAANKINNASKTFVDQKALTDANAVFLEFQSKTKFHIAALEGQVRKLEGQVATSAPAESLKVATVEPPSKKETIKPKATKDAVMASKLKPSKKVAVAKPSKTSAALARATIPKIKKKKTTTHASAKSESAAVSSFDQTYTEPAPSTESAPEVPQPPGLDNQDLPPPSTN